MCPRCGELVSFVPSAIPSWLSRDGKEYRRDDCDGCGWNGEWREQVKATLDLPESANQVGWKLEHFDDDGRGHGPIILDGNIVEGRYADAPADKPAEVIWVTRTIARMVAKKYGVELYEA